MGVSLYTIRVVLETLGAVDYGLYNVVGGIVTMFAFLSNAMANASQRFFAFELGLKNYDQLKRTFSMTMTIYFIIAVLILILGETVGLWVLNTQMTIPPERIGTVHWVYQFSIFSFMMTIVSIPYTAVIMANEKMNAYAYISFIEVCLKLLVVYLLLFFSFDKLALYAILIFVATTITTITYIIYARKIFKECHYSFYWKTSLFKEIIGYSGWTLLGSLVYVFRNQGVNILINIFFNPVINAAQAIAFRVNSLLLNLTNNFHTAVRPQIIKNYSKNAINELENLVISSSLYAYFLMVLLSFPLLVETNFILSLWLKEVPNYTIIFSRIILLNTLIEVINPPIVTAIQATGNIKLYQIVISVTQLLIFPFSYLFYNLGYPPQTSYIIMVFLSFISLIPRLLILQKTTTLSAKNYINKFLPKILSVSFICFIPLIIVHYLLPEGIIRLITILTTDLLFSTFIIYLIGLTTNEKIYVKKFIMSKISK